MRVRRIKYIIIVGVITIILLSLKLIGCNIPWIIVLLPILILLMIFLVIIFGILIFYWTNKPKD